MFSPLRVTEEANAEYGMVWVNVHPETKDLDPVYFCLYAQQRSEVVQFGFGEWHCHPDTTLEAFELAEQIVHHRKGLLIERGAAGGYLGSGLCEPGYVPEMLSAHAVALEWLFFGEPPRVEKIDESRYFRGKRSRVRHDHKKRMEEFWTEHKMRILEW